MTTVSAPRSAARQSRLGAGCLYLFFALFAGAGLAVFVPFFALPALRAIASRGWEAVPCTIVSSAVGVHSSDDGGSTYSVDVVVEYEHGGQTRRSERYGFSSGSSSGRERKAAVVARLPPGTRTTCWVDPDDPDFAVLDRSLFPWLFIGCLPLVFTAVGGAGITWLVVAGRRSRQPASVSRRAGAAARAAVAAELDAPGRAPQGLAAAGLEAFAPHGPVVLEPGGRRVAKFLGLLFATLFWNGIVGAVVWGQWNEGGLLAGGCATILLVVFGGVGLLLLAAVPHQALALANPRPVVDLSGALYVGGSVTLGWRFQGAAGRIGRLRILLVGTEVATFRQGTTTSTQRRVFLSLPLVDTTHPASIRQGSTEITLPADTMHSFAADHNKIVWSLKVEGEIARWPDVDDSHDVPVYPAEAV